MTTNEIERVRRDLLAEVNASPGERAELEAKYGSVWSTQELAHDFIVLGFQAPFVVVQRKLDGLVGSLMFQHMPRFYFGFEEHRPWRRWRRRSRNSSATARW